MIRQGFLIFIRLNVAFLSNGQVTDRIEMKTKDYDLYQHVLPTVTAFFDCMCNFN